MFDAIDTPGGHIVACFVLLALGAAFYKFGIPKGEDLIVFALGVMARSMMAAAGAEIYTTPKDQANPAPKG